MTTLKLKELKEKFTDITGMEAVKKSVLKVCEGFEAKTMKSIFDWQSAIAAIQIEKTDRYQQEIIENLNKKIEVLEENLEEVSEEVKSLENANQDLSNSLDKFENELKNLTVQRDELLAEVTDLQEEVDSLQDEIEDLQLEIESLSQSDEEESFTTPDELIINFPDQFIEGYFHFLLEGLDKKELKSKYRSLSRIYHTDSTTLDKNKAENTFKLLNDVYNYYDNLEAVQPKFNDDDIDLFGLDTPKTSKTNVESNSDPLSDDFTHVDTSKPMTYEELQKYYKEMGIDPEKGF